MNRMMWIIIWCLSIFQTQSGEVNAEDYTCTHSVYSHDTNHVLCDFWHMTQTAVNDELQLCDCKVNNGYFCISWICATISGYDFMDKNQSNSDLLNKLLLPNMIEIFGVHQCGYFTDDSLISANRTIKQYCYKYDDFKSCYCKPSATELYCDEWVCHRYLNKANNAVSLDEDFAAFNAGTYHNYWNASSIPNEREKDMKKLSVKTVYEEYRCTNLYNRSIAWEIVDKTGCFEWNGNVVASDWKADTWCSTGAWNSDTSTFTGTYNMTFNDLVGTYPYKWQCRSVIHRQKSVSTIILVCWASTIILAFIILCIYLKCKRRNKLTYGEHAQNNFQHPLNRIADNADEVQKEKAVTFKPRTTDMMPLQVEGATHQPQSNIGERDDVIRVDPTPDCNNL
eukprot:28275_1